MTTQRKYQPKEIIEDINIDDLIQIEEYKDIKLNRYYYDKANERVLKYQPLKNRYQLVKPFVVNTHMNTGIALQPAFSSKSKTYSYNKFMSFLKDKYR